MWHCVKCSPVHAKATATATYLCRFVPFSESTVQHADTFLRTRKSIERTHYSNDTYTLILWSIRALPNRRRPEGGILKSRTSEHSKGRTSVGFRARPLNFWRLSTIEIVSFPIRNDVIFPLQFLPWRYDDLRRIPFSVSFVQSISAVGSLAKAKTSLNSRFDGPSLRHHSGYARRWQFAAFYASNR